MTSTTEFGPEHEKKAINTPIGILTFSHVYNVGALLQAFALRKYLLGNGYLPSIIPMQPFKRPDPLIRRSSGRRRLLVRLGQLFGIQFTDETKEAFDRFRVEHLQVGLQEEVRSAHSVEDDYNTIIVGSDQVWARRFGPTSQRVYSLCGVQKPTRKLSYAASTGKAVDAKASIEDIGNALADFDSISVRDRFTGNAVSDVLGTQAELVVDPTGLIDWVSAIREMEITLSAHTHDIFYYGFSRVGDSLVDALAMENGALKVARFPMDDDRELAKGGGGIMNGEPIQWLEALACSRFVITRSFHGVMLALKFRKPFLVGGDPGWSSDRILDLFTSLDIPERALMKEGSQLSDVDDLDWETVYSNLDRLVKNSQEWLHDALR